MKRRLLACGVTLLAFTVWIGPAFAAGPTITSVSPIAATGHQTITITGSGFGSHQPYSLNDSYYLQISDLTKGWNAGWCDPALNNPADNPDWCYPQASPSDSITLNVTSWSDSSIQIIGFGYAYGQSGWTLDNGDQVEVDVWNPQTNAGPATYRTTVGAQPGKVCLFYAPAFKMTVTLHVGKFKGQVRSAIGHFGWGFLLNTGQWEYGANEGPDWSQLKWNGFVSKTWFQEGTWKTMLAAFRNSMTNKGKQANYYHKAAYYQSYACESIPTSNSTAAQAAVKKAQGETYWLLARDCITDAVKILQADGGNMPSSNLVTPLKWTPSNYFNIVAGKYGFGPKQTL
jgi:IPT/TIG domain